MRLLKACYLILLCLNFSACSSTVRVKNDKTIQNDFLEATGKWWYKSYLLPDCSDYLGFTGYTELTGKTVEFDGKYYAELIHLTNSNYNASRRRMLKDKELNAVGIRAQNGKYFLNSDFLRQEGQPEQMLFDVHAKIGNTWSTYWASQYLKYEITFSEKKYNQVIADTLYIYTIKQTPVAPHVPDLVAIIFTTKLGFIGYKYNDSYGDFWTIREHIGKQVLLDSCK